MAMLKYLYVKTERRAQATSQQDIEAAQKSIADTVNMAVNKSEFCGAKIRPLLCTRCL